MDINNLVKKAHKAAVDKGFYPEGKNKNIGELLMLVVSELGEALEAHRNNNHTIKPANLIEYFTIENITFD